MIDIVIPTYKPTDVLYHLIRSLKLQTNKPKSIILINTDAKSFSENLTKEQEQYILNQQNIKIHHVSLKEFNHGATRNLGFSFTTSEYVVCMTQDVTIIDKALLENLIAPCFQEEVAISYARQLPYQDCSPEEKYIREFNYPKESMIKREEDLAKLGIKTFFTSNVCAAYRKVLFDQLGGFEPHVIFNEDMLFSAKAIKAGYAVSYTADAEVVHSHRYSNKEQFHRNFDLGVSQAKNPEVFSKIRSESEGKKMIIKVTKYLMKNKLAYRVPVLYCTTIWKYAGYFLGKRYMRLPKRFVLKCSMNKNYW